MSTEREHDHPQTMELSHPRLLVTSFLVAVLVVGEYHQRLLHIIYSVTTTVVLYLFRCRTKSRANCVIFVGTPDAGKTAILSTVRGVPSMLILHILILPVAGIRPDASKPHVTTNQCLRLFTKQERHHFDRCSWSPSNPRTVPRVSAECKGYCLCCGRQQCISQWSHRSGVRLIITHFNVVPVDG